MTSLDGIESSGSHNVWTATVCLVPMAALIQRDNKSPQKLSIRENSCSSFLPHQNVSKILPCGHFGRAFDTDGIIHASGFGMWARSQWPVKMWAHSRENAPSVWSYQSCGPFLLYSGQAQLARQNQVWKGHLFGTFIRHWCPSIVPVFENMCPRLFHQYQWDAFKDSETSHPGPRSSRVHSEIFSVVHTL